MNENGIDLRDCTFDTFSNNTGVTRMGVTHRPTGINFHIDIKSESQHLAREILLEFLTKEIEHRAHNRLHQMAGITQRQPEAK